jgi:metal-dependent amidase/aminoacylase/carboxypeptidase family protein
MGVEEYKTKIREIIERNTKEYQEASLNIHEHPEVSNYEFHSSDVLIDLLKAGNKGWDAAVGGIEMANLNRIIMQ